MSCMYSASGEYQCAPKNEKFRNIERFEEPVSGFRKIPNSDIGGNDIGCKGGNTPLSVCANECANNPQCMAYNNVKANGAWGGDSGCCMKTTNQGAQGSQYPIDLYVRD